MITIEQIKSALRQHIAEAEAVPATKWKIRQSNHGTFICKDDSHLVGVPTDVCRLWNSSALEANATFIAYARTMSPTACKCLLLAIEGLENVYESDSIESREAGDILEQIRQEWHNQTK